MRNRSALCLGILLFLFSCTEKDEIRPVRPQGPVSIEKIVTIDPAMQYQVMRGFGASDCWNADFVGKYWTSGRERISELLFSREIKDGKPSGIGLSMWRTNLGGGTAEQGDASGIEDFTARAESYLNQDLTYDWTRCSGQRYFLDRAKEFGCESVVLFSNTPPVQYTRNGRGYSESHEHANLKDENYDDFAAYMAEIAAHYRASGYPVTHISPVNEPQYDWGDAGQEGSGWQNQEVARLVRELDAKLEEKQLDVSILTGEAGSWTELYRLNGSKERSMVMDAFFNPESASYIGNLKHVPAVISGHSYWTDGAWDKMRQVRKTVAKTADNYGLELWQTEWSMLGDEYSLEEFIGYDQATEMDIALYMAKVLHNDLTQAEVTSWSFWTSMDIPRWGHKNRFLLISLSPQDDDICKEGNFIACPTLWVLGNYSLFIRPGYRRIALNHKESRFFFGNAWISPEQDEIVSVYANLSDRHIRLNEEYKGVETSEVSVYTTSARHALEGKKLEKGEPPVLLPQSVTTIVCKLK